MKILPNQTNSAIISSKQGSGAANNGEVSFDELLNRLSVAGAVSQTQGVMSPSAISEPASSSEAARFDALQSAYDALDVLDRMEWTLATSSGFSDSVKETFGSLLSDVTNRLKATRDTLDPGDPLVDILNQIGVTAVVERARLERTNVS